ncbi:hypothetical protein DB30_00034 [Enhygromyxa salina]|uniref:Uncharacterized protein n=1 Tax=Enhygromyxa salina TaxID=215803 RepID=A0A0C2DDJ8_9BACT|nr:hypothetical protein [Enhygromyxa salina]KIG19525.1 hypothetical protein DB30_00034 [Enhygromyxa salina]
MLISPILAVTLATSPPPVTYEQSQANLESAADSIADLTPAQAVSTLEQALAEAEAHPRELLDDPAAFDKIQRARMALVWAYLANEQPEAATALIDLAIRSTDAQELPLSGLGPSPSKLHDERRALLEAQGHATIIVDCDACEILIDEARASNPSAPLLLGRHRVWLFDPLERLDPRYEDVELERADEPVELEYLLPSEAPPNSTVAAQRSVERAKPAQSKLPRWVKIVGIGVGAGLTVAGGILMALDGNCRDGSTPTPDNVGSSSCAKVWTNAAPGYALLGVGGGLFVGASVWLTVSEVRGRQRETTAMLAWTLRF